MSCAALLSLILAMPTGAFPVPKHKCPDFVGTSWVSDDENPTRYTFEADGVLKYRILSSGPSISKNSWKQDGARVTFELNDHYCDFDGVCDGRTIKGRFRNRASGERDITLTPTVRP